MDQNDKDLLLCDLSARLPYHVRCKIWLKDRTTEEGLLDLEHNYGNVLQDAFYYNKIKDIKPYLRPMSSMTKEEKIEYIINAKKEECIVELPIQPRIKSVDWLNANHFDYRGLIEKGLALEAPAGMYKID